MADHRRLPTLRLHARGQYTTHLDGRDHYFGRDRRVARQRFDALIARWLANGRHLPPPAEEPGGALVCELVVAYLNHAASWYRDADGEPTSQLATVRSACRRLVHLFEAKPARDLTPMDLRAYQAHLIREGLARRTCNHYLAAVKQLFRWGTEAGLVPGPTWQSLAAVRQLPAGRSNAKETAPVAPVDDDVVEATCAHLSPVVAGMVRVQRLTGMRPGEVCTMRAGDIDASGEVWLYRPRRHKLQHHGKARVVQLGPRAQAIIRERLRLRMDPDAFVFPPEHPNGGELYTTETYRQAVERAAKRAGVERWTPNQLRHSAATAFHRAYGWDIASALLGHSKPSTTSTYVDRDVRLAAEAVRALG